MINEKVNVERAGERAAAKALFSVTQWLQEQAFDMPTSVLDRAMQELQGAARIRTTGNLTDSYKAVFQTESAKAWRAETKTADGYTAWRYRMGDRTDPYNGMMLQADLEARGSVRSLWWGEAASIELAGYKGAIGSRTTQAFVDSYYPLLYRDTIMNGDTPRLRDAYVAFCESNPESIAAKARTDFTSLFGTFQELRQAYIVKYGG